MKKQLELFPDLERKPFCCYDCNKPAGDYQVRDTVWQKAWPDYDKCKREAATLYGKSSLSYLLLCLPCLEKRLLRTANRRLLPNDFDLELASNSGIKLGIRMGVSHEGQAQLIINSLRGGH